MDYTFIIAIIISFTAGELEKVGRSSAFFYSSNADGPGVTPFKLYVSP